MTSPSPIPAALARAAIQLRNHPAALRTLCVMAGEMDQAGECAIRQSTIAKRLGVSRQAVNRQFRLLVDREILMSTKIKTGLANLYQLKSPN